MPVTLNDRILLYLENCAHPLVIGTVKGLPGSVVGPNFLSYYGTRAEKLYDWAKTIDGPLGDLFRSDAEALLKKVEQATEERRVWQCRLTDPLIPPRSPVPDRLQGLLCEIWQHVRTSRRLARRALKLGLPGGVEIYREGILKFLAKAPRTAVPAMVLGAMTLELQMVRNFDP